MKTPFWEVLPGPLTVSSALPGQCSLINTVWAEPPIISALGLQPRQK